MRVPYALETLVAEGIVDHVVCQLMSGKEAEVYVVESEDELRCAKVYKSANNRSFKNRSQYTEGRKSRHSRHGRAMEKNSRFGRQEHEEAWQHTEVQALCQVYEAGVRVPKTYTFMDGVLIMELIVDSEGNPAPRLNDVKLSLEQAKKYHQKLIQDVVRMLCIGIIHGDLSEFNILLSKDGPVIIDLPQAVNAAGNNSAAALFERDVSNLARYFGRFAPELRQAKYAKEIWTLYKKGSLRPDTPLTGRFEESQKKTDVRRVMEVIEDSKREKEAEDLRKRRS